MYENERQQLKMARYGLGVPVRQVVEELGVAGTTLNRIENLEVPGDRLSRTSLTSLRLYYEAKGVEFGQDGWVRLRPTASSQTS